MPAIERFAAKIQEIGFSCQRCGACCRGDDALVLVTPDEIRKILQYTGLSWKEVVEPFPASVEIGGVRCTFEWVLLKQEDACRFLQGDKCTIHPCRPWICRTYPFHLEEEVLQVDHCPGLGIPLSEERGLEMAVNLLQRKKEEEAEELRIRSHLPAIPQYKGSRILIDGEGVRVLGG